MTLDELIKELQGEAEQRGTDEIGYEVHKNCLDLLIGEDPDTGSTVTIPAPKWN